MEKTQAEEKHKQATITSLRLLAASPKSGQELKKKLTEKGYPDEIICRVLEELGVQGILDDNAYAKDLVNRLTQGKSSGKYKVAFELKRHGVPEAIRNELLESITPDQEFDRALEQARMKWMGWATLEPPKRKKRLYDFLIRKGYDFQIAQEVLRKLMKEPLGDEV
ncbi:MAG TPA: regulatory protein RecX [Candidatus Omnitrophota bacterium]|nr:regulatory protein RecX [Candidatus Omnitrophota bacterium]